MTGTCAFRLAKTKRINKKRNEKICGHSPHTHICETHRSPSQQAWSGLLRAPWFTARGSLNTFAGGSRQGANRLFESGESGTVGFPPSTLVSWKLRTVLGEEFCGRELNVKRYGTEGKCVHGTEKNHVRQRNSVSGAHAPEPRFKACHTDGRCSNDWIN
jgi:hypothetical protein